MSRGKFLFFVISAFYACLISDTKAHVVEQFYAEYKQGSGVVVVNFDVAYAMPEVRDVEYAPQPMREWLVKRSDDEHAVLREEAERYLRSYIQFESGGKAINFTVKFPDFKSTPYAFLKLLNGGAYYNIELRGIPSAGTSDEISIRMKDGEFPKLVIAYEKDGETKFKTLVPAGLLELEISANKEAFKEDVKVDIKVDSEVKFSSCQLLLLGFHHVIPDGYDHVLFIIGMCLMASSVKQLLWQSLVFTIAHSLSMALVVSQILPIYSYWIAGYIEAIIALSIAFIAVENLFMKTELKWRYLVIAVFGFVHGLGFAGSLGSTLQFLSADHWVVPLVLANIGIEIAQALLVVGCFSLLVYLKKSHPPQLEKFLRLLSAIVIAGIGVIWFLQRLP